MNTALSEKDFWVAFYPEAFVFGEKDLYFFRNESDAENFCALNYGNGFLFDCREIEPLVEVLNRNGIEELSKTDIRYYFIDKEYRLYTDPNTIAKDLLPADQNLLTTGLINEMSAYPIVEMMNPVAREKLFNDLENQQKPFITLQRSILPVSQIEEYVLVVHEYPQSGTIYEQGHGLREVTRFGDYDTAVKSLIQIAKNLPSDNNDFMLIGRYKDKDLLYDMEGSLRKDTGYQVAGLYVDRNKTEQAEYHVYFFEDPRLVTIVKENMYLKYDRFNEKVDFYDVFGSKRELDDQFWKSNVSENENVDSLRKQLHHLQFEGLDLELLQNIQAGKYRFTIGTNKQFQQDTMEYILHYNRSPHGFYSLDAYRAILQKAIRLEDTTVNGVSIKSLEYRMSQVNWNLEAKDKGAKELSGMQKIADDLDRVDMRSRINLKAKFWAGTPYGQHPIEKEIFDLLKIANRYTHTVLCKSCYDTIDAERLYWALRDYSKELDKVLNNTLTKSHLSSIKNNVMNEQNLSFLKDKLKYSGLGEELYAPLEAKIASGVKEFTLEHVIEFNNRKMPIVAHFSRGNENEMVFFNRFQANLPTEDGGSMQKTYFMDKGSGFTAKEAFNQLEGRSVFNEFKNREGETYYAWEKLDANKKDQYGNNEGRKFNENYGYNLEVALQKAGIQEINDPSKKDQLIKSLQKGNLQIATDAQGTKISITADPESGKSNKLFMYDKEGKEITVTVKNVSATQEVGNKEELKKNGKVEVATGDDDLLGKSNKKKVRANRKGGEDNELLEKQRVGTGKRASL